MVIVLTRLVGTASTSPDHHPAYKPCCCSVLEPGRSLTLAEKGGAGAELVVGAPGFLVLATMNPGGDFGKKELSPALSNRLTQVGWRR
jgi:midasin (ATPase involved in ribosome maturation)